ncbi:MAG TPA: serine hydrolase, partial [Myxococcaceae bacterium]|nr:serine hydrolase [Myxococcaceae bacterium]
MRSARLSRWLLAAWLLFATDAAHANPAWPDALHAQVQRLARGFEGEFTLLVKDLQHGKVYGYNAEAPFYLASVVKVFVMREVYRQAELGTLRLDEEIVVSAESLRDGAGEVKGAAPGTRYTVSDLLKRMITQSDNTATDLLIERVGLDAVNRSVQELGGVDMGNITSMLDVRRKVYGRLSPKASTLSPSQVFELWKIRSLDARARALARMLGEPERRWRARDLEGAFTAYYADLENSAPMDAVGHLLESIVRCTGMRQESCDSMLATLKACETG